LAGEVDGFVNALRHLQDVRAGRANGRTFEDGRRRLQNPRLNTTYAGERQRALLSRTIDLREELANLLPAVIEAAIELELAETELAVVEEGIESLNAVGQFRETTGLYPEAAKVVDDLYARYRVDRWNWAGVDDARLERLARILRP
jgi:hypothetical protein